MGRTVRVAGEVPLPPEDAAALWRDVDRWPSFVEGFGRLLDRGAEWPNAAAKVVWESGPGGRGRVTERVLQNGPRRFATEVFEERLTGVQSASFAALPEGDGTRVELTLDYDLTAGGPLRAVTDVLFIRRALGDALGRTLRRFSVEAADDAGLREPLR